MAPALTKILKDGHGIHLSSPFSSVRVDSNGGTVHSTEVEPHMRPTDNTDSQTLLNLCLFPSLDPRLPVSPLNFTTNPVLSPSPQVLPQSPGGLLRFLSSNTEGLGHQVVSILPGVPDMFLAPVPEHNSQEAYFLQGRGALPECGPYGGDVHHSPFTLPSSTASDSSWEMKSQGYFPFLAPPPTPIQEEAARVGCAPLASERSCSGTLNFDQLASRAVLEEAVEKKLIKQADLHSKASGLQRRLQILLGEFSSRHCSQQLEGLKRHSDLWDDLRNSPDPVFTSILPPRVDGRRRLSSLEPHTSSPSLTELRELTCSGQVVLRGLEEALDSEATASSGSDDEVEERGHHTITASRLGSSSSSSRCERRWLEERAELGSRWSWLQLRLSELEGRIQQLVELHKHIRSSKGGVVLAASQPLTDQQIQQTLLKEAEGLSCTASDGDTEPCSPTRLLHSIERQSAQLTQIVRSLLPPLSFSPLSKQAQTCTDKKSFTSGRRGDAPLPAGSQRRRLVTMRRSKADACVCARTRPLVTYHKPTLFALDTRNPCSSQDGWKPSLISSPAPSSCSVGSPRDPVVMFPDSDSASSSTMSSRRKNPRRHPVLSLSFDAPGSHLPQRALAREEWSQRPLVIDAQSPTPVHFKRHSSTPLHNSHKHKQHVGRRKSRVMALSPIRTSGSPEGRHSRANQRKRRRRHVHRLDDDDDDVSLQSWEPENSSDDVLEDSYTKLSLSQSPQGCVRKRQRESVYNINNIVIPVSLAKVEKLQYKDIVTPRWRLMSAQSLTESEEAKVEDLSDEAFAQRHVVLEQKEKLRWSSWGKRKCCRRPTKSGSRLSGGGGGTFTSGEESSAEWSGAQLETDEQPGSEEWLRPPSPWERRVFPLVRDEYEALPRDSPEAVSAGGSDSGFGSSTSKKFNSHLLKAWSTGATLPSSVQRRSTTPQGS